MHPVRSPPTFSCIPETILTRRTVLEIYFARTSGLALFFFALVTLTLSGVLPLAPSSGSDTTAAPYGQATTLLTMFYHAVSSFYCWAVYSYTTRQAYTVGVTGIMLGAIGSAILGAAGVGTMLFGGDTRISKKTGLDKRTSAWPFKNEAAHPERKREMRKGM